MKILVVDDMKSMRQVLVHMLSSLGYNETSEASSGLEALKMLRMYRYDLLITDLHMPHLDGEQLLAKVRSDDKLKELPVLMVTTEDDKSKIMDVIAGQVTGFMIKPFNVDTLKKQLSFLQDKNVFNDA